MVWGIPVTLPAKERLAALCGWMVDDLHHRILLCNIFMNNNFQRISASASALNVVVALHPVCGSFSVSGGQLQ